MSRKLFLLFVLVYTLPALAPAQVAGNVFQMSWTSVIRSLPAEWYGSEEARNIAENVLLYQRDCGGWPKNTEIHRPLGEEEHKAVLTLKSRTDDATTDNNATTQEMLYLAKVYAARPDPKYRASFSRGLDYLLSAQYPNGGWPQFYPLRPGYYTRITFNDNAMANILYLLRDIIRQREPYTGIADTRLEEKARQAYEKGIECILNCQYVQNGTLTVWCAQHDEVTLEPALARSYELPSLSGSESVGLVLLLMDVEQPSPRVIRAVDAAVAWFENNKIEGLRSESYINEAGQRDYRMVKSPGAPSLWARFYTLDNNTPFFCDRDGVKKYTVEEIGHERRTGYSWYGSWGQRVLEAYPSWKEKITNNQIAH